MSRSKASAAIATIALVLAIGSLAGVSKAAGPTTVGFGTAASFAVLAGSGISNTGSSVINGDIGSFPTSGGPLIAALGIVLVGLGVAILRRPVAASSGPLSGAYDS